jgi:hypothetical protein
VVLGELKWSPSSAEQALAALMLSGHCDVEFQRRGLTNSQNMQLQGNLQASCHESAMSHPYWQRRSTLRQDIVPNNNDNPVPAKACAASPSQDGS